GSGCQGDGPCYQGRINSEDTLQYPGFPALSMELATTPDSCTVSNALGCMVFIDRLDAQMTIGGHVMAEQGRCPDEAFEAKQEPWLVEGFVGDSQRDPDTGQRTTTRCVDNNVPFSSSEDQPLNLNLARANPIPDGRLGQRALELIDGAVINSNVMFILYRERTSPLVAGGDELLSYGYMVLTRTNDDPGDIAGNEAVGVVTRDSQLKAPSCSTAFLRQGEFDRNSFETHAQGSDTGNAQPFFDQLTTFVVHGTPINSSNAIDPASGDAMVHYFCEDTGFIDGGQHDDGSPLAESVPCPVESQVSYFTLRIDDHTAPGGSCGPTGSLDCHRAWVASLACQQPGADGRGSCREQINRWTTQNPDLIDRNILWTCQAFDEVYCSDNRLDLRDGKNFLRTSTTPQGDGGLSSGLINIRAEVAEAFRYRTRFVNRQGTNVGFVPGICVSDSDTVPYCYDPAAIETLHARVDCALELYMLPGDRLSIDARSTLRAYLQEHFGAIEEIDAFNRRTTRHGFEHLNAELLIMLGDNAYTEALSSRFDLAALSSRTFQGDQFEENGINLSGIAGAEMFNLYQSIQYYQMVLDRFYRLASTITTSIDRDQQQEGFETFITEVSAATWFERLIRASTQKGRVYSEIAARYQGLNRPDLARRVIERAYIGAYLESIVFTHVMTDLIEVSDPSELAQLRSQIERAQRT
ncbi:MAG: hypothetical protein AAFS10_20795, partial [Myxococcota bacterium]